MKINYKNLKKILLIRTDHLGDLVLTLPAVFALKKTLPEAFISLVINAKNEDLLKGLSYIDEVIPIKTNSPVAILKTIKNIRKQHYDLTIQLLPGRDNCASLLTAVSGARYRVGYGVGFFSLFFNHRVRPRNPCYELENVVDIMRTIVPDLKFCGWGFEADVLFDPLYIKRIILDRIGINDTKDMIIIHPGTSKKNKKKMWPLENFVNLINKINNNFKVRILLIGTDNEKEITQKIREETGNVSDLCGMFSLTELLVLMKRSILFIGNNSGPLQIAVALDIPTVSLMGPSLFQRWAPKTEKHIVIQKKADCIPCEGTNKKCNNNICMRMISVEEVFEAVKSQLFKFEK